MGGISLVVTCFFQGGGKFAGPPSIKNSSQFGGQVKKSRKVQSEGHVYRARGSEMDDRTSWVGPDKRVPPKGKVGGACLSRPRKPTPDQDETPLFKTKRPYFVVKGLRPNVFF